MRVRIHRGTRQIGGTCVEVEHQGDRIALDFGLPLDGDAADPKLVPPISGDDLKGVVVSHPHLDHYGLLHHLPAGVPVLMGEAARRIIRAAAPFTRQEMPRIEGMALEHRKPMELGSFRITPYLVDHSAFDAYSLLIEASGKRLFYSGDFRGHGRKGALFKSMLAHPPTDIDVLLMEGSSLSRLDDDAVFPAEADLEEQFAAHMRSTPGLVMAHASAQNIDRIVTLYRACRKTGRTLVIDLYAAAILEATGGANIPQSSWPGIALYVPESQRRLIKRNGWFELLERHSKNRIYAERIAQQPAEYAMLFRPLMMPDLENAQCLAGAGFVYSQWEGYLDSGTYAEMEAWLGKHGIEMAHIHTSGHASPVDLKDFAEALAPRALVPIHSFAPEKYEAMFANVVYREDGEWWEV